MNFKVRAEVASPFFLASKVAQLALEITSASTLKRALFHVVTAASLLGLATTASAKGVLYDCTVTQKKQSVDWISDRVAIVVRDDGQVTVSDSVIQFFKKRPIPAKIDRNNDRKLHVRWVLEDVVNGSNQQTPYFDYTAHINKKTMRFAIYANPENFPNRFSGKGSCTLRTEK